MELKPQSTLTTTFIVQQSDLASATTLGPEDQYAHVFATSRMIAIMEVACARLMNSIVPEGQLSVGVNVDISHLAATPVGAEVTTTAAYEGKQGKLYVFTVSSRDAGGEIGRGRHTRAVIDAQRLESGAQKRVAKRHKL